MYDNNIMSELKDNESMRCSYCDIKMSTPLFCKTTKKFNNNVDGQYTYRCHSIVCEDCEYCVGCEYQIIEFKKTLKKGRYGKPFQSENCKYTIERLNKEYGIILDEIEKCSFCNSNLNKDDAKEAKTYQYCSIKCEKNHISTKECNNDDSTDKFYFTCESMNCHQKIYNISTDDFTLLRKNNQKLYCSKCKQKLK